MNSANEKLSEPSPRARSPRPSPDEPPVFEDVAASPSSGPAHAAFRRVLVIDDHPDAASTLELFFVMRGYEAASAMDGLEGIQTAEAFRPEVVLLDLGLPRLNGYETARRLRRAPWGRHMLIVALTGLEQSFDEPRALEAGCDHYVCKPVVDVDAFLNQLNVWANVQ